MSGCLCCKRSFVLRNLLHESDHKLTSYQVLTSALNFHCIPQTHYCQDFHHQVLKHCVFYRKSQLIIIITQQWTALPWTMHHWKCAGLFKKTLKDWNVLLRIKISQYFDFSLDQKLPLHQKTRPTSPHINRVKTNVTSTPVTLTIGISTSKPCLIALLGHIFGETFKLPDWSSSLERSQQEIQTLTKNTSLVKAKCITVKFTAWS